MLSNCDCWSAWSEVFGFPDCSFDFGLHKEIVVRSVVFAIFFPVLFPPSFCFYLNNLEVKGWSNRVVFAYGLWNEPLPSVFV